MARKTVEKFRKQPETDVVEMIEMELTEYSYPKSGTGICPQCGGEMNGLGLDWTCQGCDLVLKGPVF